MLGAVVLDACVLVPYPLFDVLLRLANEHIYKPVWSETILAEVERTCVRKLDHQAHRVRERIRLMNEAFPAALVSGYDAIVDSMPNHPKDRHVLAAAVVAKSGAIVTANLRDFPAGILTQYGIEAIHPDDFLLGIYDLNPRATKAALEGLLSANASPPKTIRELAEFLRPTTPAFAAELLRGPN